MEIIFGTAKKNGQRDNWHMLFLNIKKNDVQFILIDNKLIPVSLNKCWPILKKKKKESVGWQIIDVPDATSSNGYMATGRTLIN